MKVLFAAMSAMLALVAVSAHAGPWRGFDGGYMHVQMQRQRPGQFQRPPQRDFRRAEQPPDRGPRSGDGRMTEEERRDLRRDLERADREIYKRQRR